MSISKSVGRCTLLALVVYLFVKGALIVVPRKMVAAVSTLVAALVHACCGTDGSASMQGESAVVVAMATAPIHDLRPLLAEGEGKMCPQYDQGAEHAPPQGKSFK